MSVFSLYFLHLLKLMLVTKWELMLSLGKPSVLGSEEERGEVAGLLISHGANRDILNREEKSPLELCSSQFARSLKS